MESKSLYTILGIRPDASADQIEHAYAELLHQLKDGVEANPGGDARIRLVAVKEAYSVLSNPVSRQMYNQKIFAPQTVGSAPEIVIEPSNSWGIVKLLVIGSIVIAAIWTYNRNAIEKEKLLIEHEKQIIETQVRLEQEKREQQTALQQTQLQRRQQYEDEARDRRMREQAIRDSREVDYRLQRDAREQQIQQQREAREKQQAAREAQYQQQQEESRQRQLKLEAERQIDREKRALRELQNQNSSSNRYY